MKNVKWCVPACVLIFVLFQITEAKTPVAQDKNIIISDEERRGAAEKSKDKEALLELDHKKAETTKRGIYLAAKHHIPGSLITPALRLTYNVKDHHDNEHEADTAHHYAVHKSAHPEFGKSGFEYYTSHFPTEHAHYHHGDSALYSGHPEPAAYSGHADASLYGHTDSALYGHTGSGVYEYPGAEFAPSTGFENFKKGFGFKKYLLPLAGLALLGAAAALTVNPVLLQLGAITGKRRRRSVSPEDYLDKRVYPINEYVRPDLTRKVKKS